MTERCRFGMLYFLFAVVSCLACSDFSEVKKFVHNYCYVCAARQFHWKPICLIVASIVKNNIFDVSVD